MKTPLYCLLSVYTNSETAIAANSFQGKEPGSSGRVSCWEFVPSIY